MLSGDKFLAALEPKGLVPSDVLAALWRQVRQSPRPIEAAVIAQWLVERNLLTRDQADALLAEAGQGGQPAAGGAKPDLGKLPTSAMQSLLDEELSPIDGAGGRPLDALLAAGAMDEAEGDVLGEPPPPKRWRFRRWLKNLFRRDRSQVVRVRQADPRQVKILLGSWGVAVGLALGAFAAFWYFSPLGPGQLVDQADSAYKAGNYEEAIRQVDVFLEAYPKDERASRMRMLRGLAEMRAAVEAARADGNWLKPCELAHALMGKLPSEITYAEWQGEIGALLATLAEGMARQARQSPDSKIVNQARGVIRLIESKVAVHEQPREKLSDVNRLLAMSESRVARDDVLQEAVTTIETAVDDGLPMAAYRAALAAIKQYPELAGNEALVKALKPAGDIQRKAVKMVDRPQAAETSERASDVVASVALGAPTVRGSLPSGRDRLLFVPWQGATYCLDVGTGRLRWRRFVAAVPPGVVAPCAPVRLGTAPDEDVILVDPVEHELLRVETADGRLVWRSPIGKPLLAEPVRAGNRLLAPTVENRLVLVNLLGGDSPGYLQMPQPIRLAPVVDGERSLIYQVCDSSTLLVLSLATWKCEQVIYLGHAEGAVAAPPVVAGDFLLVAVNEGPNESVLHVFRLGPEGKGPGEQGLTCVQQVRMRGTISRGPVVQGSRVAVVTDQGNVQVFLVDDQKPKSPLQHFARSEAGQQESLVRYALFLGNRIWVADRQLGRYEIQTSDNRVVLRWITDQNSRFVQPLASAMGAVIHVRVRQDMPGVLVSAVRTESHEPIWQTWVGAPMAAEPRPSADGNALTTLTTGGAMFRFDLKGVKDRATSSTPVMAVDAVKLTQPLVDVVPLEGGGFAMTAGPGGKQIFIYDPKEEDKRFRSLVSPQAMAASPVALAGGILVPCRDGQVFLLDTQSSQQRAKAFRPSLKIDSPWNWTTPAALGANEVLLCDGDRRLYRLRLQEGQEPSLVEAAAAKASGRIVGGVAVLDKTAFAIGAKGEAMAFGLPDLAEGKLDPAGAGPAWGPWLAGQYVLVATEKNRLCCYNARRELAWTVDLKYGVPVGRPLVSGDDIFLASRQGTVWRVAAADGKQSGKVEAACPLATGPVLAGQRLFVGTPDGCLLELKRP